MDEYDQQMLAYLMLSRVSDEKLQPGGRNRFWILAGIAACRAGRLDVAARCRESVIASNPQHLLAKYPTIPDALRDAEFEPFLRQLERFCGIEQAEHFLRQQGLETPRANATDTCDPGEIAMTMLPATDE